MSTHTDDWMGKHLIRSAPRRAPRVSAPSRIVGVVK